MGMDKKIKKAIVIQRRDASLRSFWHLSGDLSNRLEQDLYCNIYAAVAARLGDPVLQAVRTIDGKEGPFI